MWALGAGILKKWPFFGVKKIPLPPRPHTSDRTFDLHPNNHFNIEKQNCQISFLKNNWKFWMPASSKCIRYKWTHCSEHQVYQVVIREFWEYQVAVVNCLLIRNAYWWEYIIEVVVANYRMSWTTKDWSQNCIIDQKSKSVIENYLSIKHMITSKNRK